MGENPKSSSSSSSTSTAIPFNIGSPHTARPISSDEKSVSEPPTSPPKRRKMAEGSQMKKKVVVKKEDTVDGEKSSGQEAAKKSSEEKSNEYVNELFRDVLLTRSMTVVSPMTISVKQLATENIRGELLRPISSSAATAVHDILQKEDESTVLNLLLNNWSFIKSKKSDVGGLIAVNGSTRIFCLRALLFTRELSDEILNLETRAVCYAVEDYIFSDLFNNCKGLDRDWSELDKKPAVIPSIAAPLVSSIYTREQNATDYAKFTLFDNVNLIVNTVLSIYPPKVRRCLSGRKIETAARMLEETKVVPTKLRFAVELAFAEKATRIMLLELAKKESTVYASDKCCLTGVLASRIDDEATAEALKRFARSNQLKKKFQVILGSKDEEECSEGEEELNIEPTVKRRKMAEQPWKKCCELKKVSLSNKDDWEMPYIPILYENEVSEEELQQWLNMIDKCTALLLISGNSAFDSLAAFLTHPAKQKTEIVKAGGKPRVVAVFASNKGFLASDNYNKNIEEVIKSLCSEQKLR